MLVLFMDLSEAVLQKVQFMSMSVTEMAWGRVLRMPSYQWACPSHLSTMASMAPASGRRLPERSTSRTAVLSPALTARAYCSIFFRGASRLAMNKELNSTTRAAKPRPGSGISSGTRRMLMSTPAQDKHRAQI